MGVRVNPNKRTLKNVYRTYIDVMNYVKTSTKSFNIDDKTCENQENASQKEDADMVDEAREQEAGKVADLGLNDDKTEFTEKEIREFRKFAEKPHACDLLVDALAPSICENEDMQNRILCQLFGGVSKECVSGQGRMRGEINILMCGDPSTAKSQLL